MSVSENIKWGTHAVFKWDDIRKYLSEKQREQIRQIASEIGNGRVKDGKNQRKCILYLQQR